MFSGSKAVPATICPAIVNVATRMPSGSKSAPSMVAADRSAALPREMVRMAGAANLCHDDGADDVNRIGRLQVLDARAQELVRSSHDCVVDDEPGRTLLVVELSHPSSQTFRVAGICRDRVNLGSGVSEAVGEI